MTRRTNVQVVTGYRPGLETKERILDAAEILFATRPLADISIRDLTAAADVNLAAINYHFGTKEDLLNAAFLRRIKELNRERLTLLAKAEASAGSEFVPLEQILHALVAPTIQWFFGADKSRRLHVRLISRMITTDSPLRATYARDVQHLSKFVRYLSRALPKIKEEDLLWRLHFTLGALHMTVVDFERLQSLSDGQISSPPVAEVVQRLVDFASVGLARKK